MDLNGRYLVLAVGWTIMGLVLCAASVGVVGPAWGVDDAPGVELRVAGMLDIHPPLPGPDEEVEIGVWVENRGDEDASDVLVYFYEDGRSFDREVVDVRAKDMFYIEVSWTADEGDHYLSVAVDPGGEYDEDKGDNRTGTWVMVR